MSVWLEFALALNFIKPLTEPDDVGESGAAPALFPVELGVPPIPLVTVPSMPYVLIRSHVS